MPIWLRTFTFNKLKEHYDKQQEEQDKQNNMLTSKNSKELSRPNISPQPDYISRAPKK
jgi:hypothetical protein